MDTHQEHPLPSLPFPFPLPINPPSIPLHCCICSKKPTFSDISHLLTHIASKGHLSTYYKVKITAATEQDARILIEQYDKWYDTWGIEALMSERMNTKESRRKQKSRQPRPLAAAAPKQQPLLTPATDSFMFDVGVDPFLDNSTIKQEDSKYTVAPVWDPLNLPFTTPSWLSATFNDGEHLSTSGYHGSDADNEVSTASMYSPTPSRFSAFNTSNESTSIDLDDGAGADGESKSVESSRLKGVLWPGMDIFDAATPDMRRKRNQKKSTDVITRLEAVSREVEATEVVYSANGILQKERPITGYPDPDSSPILGEPTPPPKKPRQAPRRKPLAPRDANAQTMMTSQRGGRRRGPTQGETGSGTMLKSKRGSKTAMQHSPVARSPLVSSQTPQLTYLTSAFEYRSGLDSEPAIMQFRPATEWTGYTHLPPSTAPVYPSAIADDPTLMSAWDFLGSDITSTLLNPLFMEHDAVAGGDEHGGTNSDE